MKHRKNAVLSLPHPPASILTSVSYKISPLLTLGLKFCRYPIIQGKTFKSGEGTRELKRGILLHMLISLWSTGARVFADLISTEHMPASQDLPWPHTHSIPVFQNIQEDWSSFLQGATPEKQFQYNPAFHGKRLGSQFLFPVSVEPLLAHEHYEGKKRSRHTAIQKNEEHGNQVLKEEAVAIRKLWMIEGSTDREAG